MYTQHWGERPNLFAASRKGALLGFTLGVSSPATTVVSNRFRNGSDSSRSLFMPGVPSLSETMASLYPVFFNFLTVASASGNGGLALLYASQYRRVVLCIQGL